MKDSDETTVTEQIKYQGHLDMTPEKGQLLVPSLVRPISHLPRYHLRAPLQFASRHS